MFGLESLDKCAEDQKQFNNTALKMFIERAKLLADNKELEALLHDFTEVATQVKNYSNLWKLRDTEYANGLYTATFVAKRTQFSIRLVVEPSQDRVDMILCDEHGYLSSYKSFVGEDKKTEFTPLANVPGVRYPTLYLYGEAGLSIENEASRLFHMYIKNEKIKKTVLGFTKEHNIIFGW